MQRARLELEADLRNLENQFQKQSDEAFRNGIFLKKDEASETEKKRRHDKEMELTNALVEKKLADKEQLQNDLNALNQQYLSMNELQESIKEAERLRERIEQLKVQIQMSDIKVKVLTEANEFLQTKKEELQDEKAEADQKNEELRTQVKAQEEVANKRLQSKLQRDKA